MAILGGKGPEPNGILIKCYQEMAYSRTAQADYCPSVASPESRREKDENREDLEPTHNHEEREEKLAGIRHCREALGGSHDPESGPDVVERRGRSGQGGDDIHTQSGQRQRPEDHGPHDHGEKGENRLTRVLLDNGGANLQSTDSLRSKAALRCYEGVFYDDENPDDFDASRG